MQVCIHFTQLFFQPQNVFRTYTMQFSNPYQNKSAQSPKKIIIIHFIFEQNSFEQNKMVLRTREIDLCQFW